MKYQHAIPFLFVIYMSSSLFAQTTPVIRAEWTGVGRPILSEYAFGANGVVYCSSLFRDTFQQGGESIGTWTIDDKQRVVISWYQGSILQPGTTETIQVDLAKSPLLFQIVDHDDKSQVDSITKVEIEKIGGIPSENAKSKLKSVIGAIDATHVQLLFGGGNITPLQRREMFKRLDTVELAYRKNQSHVSTIKSNPLKPILIDVPADEPIREKK